MADVLRGELNPLDLPSPKFRFGNLVRFISKEAKSNGATFFYDGIRARVFACRWTPEKKTFEYRLIFQPTNLHAILSQEELLFISKETLWASEYVLEKA